MTSKGLQPQPEISSSSTDEGVFKFDSSIAVALPPEMLTHLLEMYCKNLELDELKKLRLVSKAWRDALERLWRKRVTVALQASSMKYFLKIIKEPSFNHPNCPMKRFQIIMATFTEKEDKITEGVNEFWDICAPRITHLELKIPRIANFQKLLETILLKLVNMEKFSLVAPETLSEVVTQGRDAGTLANIRREKLTCLKLDMREEVYSNDPAENDFPYPLTWYQFLSSFPNLQELEMFSEGTADESNIKFRPFQHRYCLQAVKTLALEGGLQKLKHLQIWRRELPRGYQRNFTNCVTDICLSNLPSLESLHFEFMPHPYGLQDFLSTRMILKKIGSRLKRLSLNVPFWFSTIFPFGQKLEKLENLSVSLDIAHFIRNANGLPNLKCFSVFAYRKTTTAPTATIIWQDNINNLTRTGQNANPQLRMEFPPNIHNYDDSTEDDEEVNEDLANLEELYTRTTGLGFLFDGYKLLRGSLTFVNVTSLHLECKISCKVFKNVPRWMPNVTTLEATLAACVFPVVCDKWRNLEKLTLLDDWDDRYDKPLTRYANFVPVDDCAIIGKKHLTSANCRCSFGYTRALENFVPSESTEITEADDPIIPNISYLTHLKYFKMQTGRATNYGKNFNLSDASAFHGFYKLPQLEYLEIIADLQPETIQELFKRVPRCIVYKLCSFDVGFADTGRRKYYGVRNFNLGKW